MVTGESTDATLDWGISVSGQSPSVAIQTAATTVVESARAPMIANDTMDGDAIVANDVMGGNLVAVSTESGEGIYFNDISTFMAEFETTLNAATEQDLLNRFALPDE